MPEVTPPLDDAALAALTRAVERLQALARPDGWESDAAFVEATYAFHDEADLDTVAALLARLRAAEARAWEEGREACVALACKAEAARREQGEAVADIGLMCQPAAALARAREEGWNAAIEEAARHVETLAEREEYRLLPTRARAMRDAAKECRALARRGAAP